MLVEAGVKKKREETTHLTQTYYNIYQGFHDKYLI